MEQSAFNFRPKVGSLIVTGLIALICIITIYNQIKYGQKISFVAAVFLFSAGFLFIIFLKTTLKKPGLIISNEGIINNTILGAKSYLIPWDNIKSLQGRKTVLKYTLLVFLDNPEEIIKEQSFALKLDMMNKMKKFGTPAVINLDALKSYLEVKKKLEEEFISRYPEGRLSEIDNS
jgi:hypothetical protein